MRPKQRRYEQTEKGRATKRRYQQKRIRVLGETAIAPDMEARKLMRRLRDERKATGA